MDRILRCASVWEGREISRTRFQSLSEKRCRSIIIHGLYETFFQVKQREKNQYTTDRINLRNQKPYKNKYQSEPPKHCFERWCEASRVPAQDSLIWLSSLTAGSGTVSVINGCHSSLVSSLMCVYKVSTAFIGKV